MVVLLLLAISPVHLRANDALKPATTNSADAEKAAVLINRLEEIKKMDKSALSPSEKKELRKEVRETKRELKTTNGGVYLSVGAAIIIVLLLILLL